MSRERQDAPDVRDAPRVTFHAPTPDAVCPRCGAQDGQPHYNVHHADGTPAGFWARCPLAAERRP